MKDDLYYLDHILECIEWIEDFAGDDEQAFLKDRKTQSAVLRELQTLSESTQRLSDPLKKSHPEIPWENISGFRNKLVHDYLGIKLERVWEVIRNDLPPLRSAAEAMKKRIEAGL